MRIMTTPQLTTASPGGTTAGAIWPTFTPGMKIRFADEKQSYTVQAVSRSGRYVVCTKPFNARRSILHSVMDLALGIRGSATSWAVGYGTPQDCQDTAAAFDASDTYEAMYAAGELPAAADDPHWLARHPELVDSQGRQFLTKCEVSYRNWAWIRLDDRQSDTRTAALIADIRALVAAAPARDYNDFDPRTPSELSEQRATRGRRTESDRD